jgi:RNA polymerase sigma factor (sigma-70 family)
MDSPSDSVLLQRFVEDKDETAFEALVRKYGPTVLGVCRRVLGNASEVDDAFQATFLMLAQKAGSIRQSQYLGTWLYRVAYNVALKLRQQLQKDFERHMEFDESKFDNPELQKDWDQLSPVLDEELNRLPEKFRSPLILCYFERVSYEEAADRLGWSLSTIRGRINSAKDLLRGRLLRRGVVLSASALGMLLTSQARAAVPSSMVDASVKTACSQFPEESLGAISIKGVAICEEMGRWFFLQKLRLVVVSVFAVTTLGAATVFGVKEIQQRKTLHFQQLSAALFEAVYQKNAQKVEELLSQGADVHARYAEGRTPVLISSTLSDLPTLEVLVKHGGNVEDKTTRGITSLMFASIYGNTNMVEYLLSKGAGLEVRDSVGSTAVMLGVFAGQLDVVQLLQKRGANLHVKNRHGETAMSLAAKSGNVSVVEYLKKEGFPYRPDLYTAAGMGDLQTVEKLIQEGHDVNLKDRASGFTPLMYAASAGHVDAVKLLVEQGANVNFTNAGGLSPLRVSQSHPVVQQVLRKAGALDRPVTTTKG